MSAIILPVSVHLNGIKASRKLGKKVQTVHCDYEGPRGADQENLTSLVEIVLPNFHVSVSLAPLMPGVLPQAKPPKFEFTTPAV